MCLAGSRPGGGQAGAFCCWGGGQAFGYAAHNKTIKAAYAFYGTGPTDEASIKRIEAPVYGFYGGNDARVNATMSDAAAGTGMRA